MIVLLDVLAIAAALATAVIFGTDALGALVMRPTYAALDDATMTRVVGLAHRYGNARMPVAGVLSVVAAAAATLVAFLSGHPSAGTAAGAGLLLLLIWLVLFNRVALPINNTFIAAAAAGRVPPDARRLQERWDSIINLRAALQGAALLGFCLTLVLAA
ncbi:DUF1772 domain-containing protein [Dactylosporangium matsuzakiense]|uniref:DUF1772 domain-containing protein n=1 Tax=Dactylosporangium matsuzakiense TaxID=53360 RepID=A0A9W6KGA6_9ACTN|nr:DUF1772 domain-containing protein [Dactylosporangium matsuzakiense]UWZ41117.1 DUF1772 domain-containing protein [Dactylosporangium matsuzakiense]GLL00983.1 hypothetical protein GCM10017581_027240 [Dactylosporangium matsuzakiense]